eukprot:3401453-Rhodomonas_salina.2
MVLEPGRADADVHEVLGALLVDDGDAVDLRQHLRVLRRVHDLGAHQAHTRVSGPCTPRKGLWDVGGVGKKRERKQKRQAWEKPRNEASS